MPHTREAIVGHPDERGSALIGVLLLLMMMSALVAALAVNGRTETFISRNQYSGAQAQAAAEAGLNHAVELATTYIFEWKANGLESPEQAVNFLLVGPDQASGTEEADEDNGSLGARVGIDAAAAIPVSGLEIADGIVAKYTAFVYDDDATAPTAGDLVEQPFPFYDPLTDLNKRLIVQATGYGPNNTKVVLEAVISPIPLPAVVTNGNLEISDGVVIDGDPGSVHVNGDLTMSGSASVSHEATASGVRYVPEDTQGSEGAALLPVPEVRASDYRVHARFILTAAGTMVDLLDPGTPPCTWADGSPCNNWDFDAVTGAWSIAGVAPDPGTYYVEGRVNVTGSDASSVDLTIIAEGSINISGSYDVAPDSQGFLFVTDGDLDISGGLTALDRPGQMLVHEQVKLSGSAALAAQLLVENAPSEDSLVEENEISGTVRITYNGDIVTSVYGVTGWRDVRQ